MSAKKTDIQQLSQYLKGELDAHVMHVLEKQALNDPFLMDAMDGFEAAGADQQTAFNELEHRLAQRIKPAKGRTIIAWQVIGIAASVLLVLSIGGLWLFKQPKVQPRTQSVAQVTIPVIKKPADTLKVIKPASILTASVIKPAPKKQAPVLAAEEPPANLDIKDDAVYKGNAAPSFGYNAPVTVKTDSFRLAKAKDASYLKEVKIGGTQALAQQTLLSKVPGVSVQKPEKRLSPQDELAITGKISNHNYDADLRTVPAAANIRDSNYAAVSEYSAGFIGAADKKSMAGLTSRGYVQQPPRMAGKDSLSALTKAKNAALSEVAVTAGSKKKEKAAKVIPEAHPQIGWDSFYQYLKNGAIAGQKVGNVRLTFLVNGDGSVTDFDVNKSMGAAIDQLAIDLVKNGPAWLPNTDGKPEIVNLKIHFSKKP